MRSFVLMLREPEGEGQTYFSNPICIFLPVRMEM